MLQTWSDVFAYTFQEFWMGIVTFVPKLLVAVIIFIFGWVIAVALGRLVNQVIRALRVDKLFQAMGAEEPLAKAGFRLDTGAFIGGLVKWFFIVVFLIASIDILGLDEVNFFLRDVVLGYIPNVIVASLILVVAAFVSDALQKVVVGSAKAANVPSSHLLGGVTKWSVWVFAILAALYHLGIAGVFAQTIFTGLVAMLAIAGGIAFGIGGKDAAARFIEKMRQDIGGRQ